MAYTNAFWWRDRSFDMGVTVLVQFGLSKQWVRALQCGAPPFSEMEFRADVAGQLDEMEVDLRASTSSE